RVHAAFERLGCRAVFLKGVVTEALYFGGSGLRGARDLDVIIAKSQVSVADAALRTLGYWRHIERRRRISESAKPARLYIHRDRVGYPDVDLHVGLLKTPPYPDCGVEALARAQWYETSYGSFYGFTREDMLAYAAGNLAGSKFFSGRWKLALDATAILVEDRVDLQQVVERTRRWGVAWALWGLLRLVEERLDVFVPATILKAIEPSRRARVVIERIAGVSAAPHVLHTGRARLWQVDRLVVQRPLWLVEAPLRELGLRTCDRLCRPGLNDFAR
ncbi:MAG: nucleotidyltransferase family protein, partial [Myxococcota bacterium]